MLSAIRGKGDILTEGLITHKGSGFLFGLELRLGARRDEEVVMN